MILNVAVLALVILQDAPITSDAEVAKLVKSIAEKPGIYSQVCSMMFRADSVQVAVSAGGISSHSEHGVSTTQFESLRKVREGAIKALVAWLDAGGKSCEDDEHAWVNPGRHKLNMIVDLNATAALPGLVKRAERLAKEAGEPAADADEEQVGKMSKELQVAFYAKAGIVQDLNHTLSTILALLRQEKFEPLLASSIEKDTQAGLSEAFKKGWLAEVSERARKAGEVDAKDRVAITHDPVTGQIASLGAYPTLKADPAMVRRIIAWGAEAAKRPADQRRDAKGMSAWPINR